MKVTTPYPRFVSHFIQLPLSRPCTRQKPGIRSLSQNIKKTSQRDVSTLILSKFCRDDSPAKPKAWVSRLKFNGSPVPAESPAFLTLVWDSAKTIK